MAMRKTGILMLLIMLCGCGSGGVKSSEAPRSNRDLITRAQLEESTATNVYDLIQRARPEVLRTRGTTSIRNDRQIAVVYVDGVRRGSPDILKQFRLSDVEEVRFVNGPDATTRYGTGHGGGAIEIKTRIVQVG